MGNNSTIFPKNPLHFTDNKQKSMESHDHSHPEVRRGLKNNKTITANISYVNITKSI